MAINYEKRRAKVAARLLASKLPKDFHFKMSQYLLPAKEIEEENWCGTAGCMAGLAVMMYAKPEDRERLRKVNGAQVEQEAAKILGLNEVEADALFVPSFHLHDTNEVQAGRVFANFIRSGEINWLLKNEPIRVGKRKF